MNTKRLRTLLASVTVAVTAAYVLSACGGTSAAGGEAGEPVYGGTLTFFDPVDYAAWTPTNSLWSNSNVTGNLAERLLWQDPETGDFEPWLAKSWEVSADHLVYTFVLRDDVTFSNGDPLDAETVKLNFDQHGKGDEKLGIPQDPFWTDYADTTAIDAHTVEVKLSKPNAAFLQVLSNYRASSILGKPFLEQDLNGQGDLKNWVGTGPFVVDEVDGTTGVTLKRRDDYDWAPGGAAHQGKAYLSEIVFKTVPEAGTRVGALQSGEAQIARNIAPYDEETVEAGGGKLLAIPVQGETNDLTIQAGTAGPTQDLRVRQAIQAATDRKEINETVLSPSYGIPTSELVKGTPLRGDASEYLDYDLDKAKVLLEEAGWKAGGDGIRVKEGKRLSFHLRVAPFYQVSKSVLELLQSQWKKAGIEVKITQPSLTDYQAQEAASPADWVFSQGQTSTAEAGVLRTSWSIERQNSAGFTKPDATLEKLLEQQSQAFDEKTRKNLVQQVEDRIFSQAYSIPLYDETQVFGLSDRVHGFATESTARSWLYDTWLAE